MAVLEASHLEHCCFSKWVPGPPAHSPEVLVKGAGAWVAPQTESEC